MNKETELHLLSLGVPAAICSNCFSEDFNYYKVLGTTVICCEDCCAELKKDVSGNDRPAHQARYKKNELRSVRF